MSKAAALSSVPKTPKHTILEKFACLLYYCVRKELEENPKSSISAIGLAAGLSKTDLYSYMQGRNGCSPKTYGLLTKKFPLLEDALEYPPDWSHNDGQTRTLLTGHGRGLYQTLAAAGDAILYTGTRNKPASTKPVAKKPAVKKPPAPSKTTSTPAHDDAHTPITAKGFASGIEFSGEIYKLVKADRFAKQWLHLMSLALAAKVPFAMFIDIVDVTLPQKAAHNNAPTHPRFTF